MCDSHKLFLLQVLHYIKVSDTQNRLLFQVLHGVHVPGAQRVLDNRKVRETSGRYTFLHGDCSGCVVHRRVLSEVRSVEYTAISFNLWGYIFFNNNTVDKTKTLRGNGVWGIADPDSKI